MLGKAPHMLPAQFIANHDSDGAETRQMQLTRQDDLTRNARLEFPHLPISEICRVAVR